MDSSPKCRWCWVGTMSKMWFVNNEYSLYYTFNQCMIIDYLLNIFYSQIADTEIQWHSWIDIYMLNRFFAFFLLFVMAGMVISWCDAYMVMTLSGILPQNWCGDVHTVKDSGPPAKYAFVPWLLKSNCCTWKPHLVRNWKSIVFMNVFSP